jgi:DNA-binding NarL/FixJ family response regulator
MIMTGALHHKATTSTITVAVVEDDPILCDALVDLLHAEPGFGLTALYKDAEQAMEQLPGGPPDVVIMDIGLPGLNGIECVRDLAPSLAHTQFLMYTTHDDDERVFEALRAGANGYILKSSSPDEIITAVKELVAGGAPMSTAVARRVVEHMRPKAPPIQNTEARLSAREQEVLEQLAQGLLYKEIAAQLGISESTVRQHIHRIYEKLHVTNRTEALNRFYDR